MAKDVDLQTLARATSGLVGSDIHGICQRACMTAIREFVGKVAGKPSPEDLATLEVTSLHFAAACKARDGRGN